MPSCCPLNQPQRRAWKTASVSGGEVREVSPDQRRLRDHVGAGQRRVEPVGGCRDVAAHRARVRADGPGPEGGGLCGGAVELGHPGGIGGGEEIAAPVHAKDIAALAGQFLEQVDAPVHDGDHRVTRSRPPVAVALRRLVAGERERGALVDEHDAAHAAPHRQVIRRRHAGDAGPADHHSRARWRHGSLPVSARHPHRGRVRLIATRRDQRRLARLLREAHERQDQRDDHGAQHDADGSRRR